MQNTLSNVTKIDDMLLHKLEKLEAEKKQLDADIKAIKADIQDYCEQYGDYISDYYTASYSTSQREALVGKTAFIAALGYDTLQQEGLLKYSTVKNLAIKKLK